MSRALLLPLAASLVIACRSAGPPAPAGAARPGVPAASTATPPPGAIPLNPAIRRTQLANGLTFYVRQNAKPEKRAVLWLVVDAGSVLEEDGQRGLAHFLEHMAFNGTRRFAKQEIVNSLQRMGMRFGPDINAFTSFDETVYQIEVPTDKPASLERAVEILHEWAQGIALEKDEVDKERGVVLEERRLGRGAQGRLLDALIPAALPGSRYGARLPIGTEEVLKRATAEDLRRFYRDWYRPDRMAVVAVGDFDPAAMERRIADRFADLRAPGPERPRPDTSVPAHAETVALSLKDAELPITAVGVVAKRPRRPLVTESDFRRELVGRLFTTMLNHRLDELRRAPDAPFLGAAVGRQNIIRPVDAWFQVAVVKGDKVGPSLEALTAEVARVARSGFTDGEIDRAKKDVLRAVQQQAHEEGKTPSRAYAAEIQRLFLNGEAAPGSAVELAMVERILPGITGDEIRKVAGEVSSEESRVIAAAGHASATLPDKAQLLAAAAAGTARAAAAYVDETGGGPLVANAPKPGAITRERTIPELGVTEWRLSNGLTVVLKPTDFQNDSVQVSLRTPGGTSLARDRDFLSARSADEIADASGFGEYGAVKLEKRLAGTGVSSDVQFGELGALVGGSAPRDQIELLLQLVHLEVTAPRRDEAAFTAWKASEVEALRNQLASPEVAFEHRFASEASGGNLRRRLPTAADYEAVDLDRALSFYRARFANLSGSTAVLVGSFDVEKVKPLVLAYLGGLPGRGAAPRWRDVGVKRPRGAHQFELVQGIEPKARVRLEFHGQAKWSREADQEIDSLAQALRIRLREELREEMGGVYGVSVSARLDRDPTGEFELVIDFGCAPENRDRLLARARAELEAFRREGPPADVVEKVAEAQRREYETALKDNRFWGGALTEVYRLGLDPRVILDHERLVARLNPALLQAAARRYTGPNEILGQLVPR